MTEEEKQGLRQLKADVIVYLQGEREELYRRFREALVETDPRIGEYVLGCILHPEAHNLYELLGVKRFFYLLSRYEWRPGRVRHFFRFYEALKFSGLEGRRRYRLTPVQAFIFANIYGFYHDGLRLIRTAYLFVPRKFSKTTSVASMALYDMLFGDHNAQAYIGANSYNQAKICFDEIRAIMSGLDPDGRHIRINREQIFFKDRGRDSLIRCLTANAKTQDGLNASLAILDEYAQARDTSGKSGAALKNVLTSSMGVRKQPLTVVCTTASDVVDGPFARELDGVLQVLREELENDSIYAAIFMPDVDDAESDPATWRKVQPHLGVTVREDYYAKEWADAQLSADKLLEFRTKLLNIFAVNERSAWITSKVVGSATRSFALGAFGRVPAMCALDLSESDDFSAVSFGIYRQQERSFWFYTRRLPRHRGRHPRGQPGGGAAGHRLRPLEVPGGHQHAGRRRREERPPAGQADLRLLHGPRAVLRARHQDRPRLPQRQPHQRLLLRKRHPRRGQSGEPEAGEAGGGPQDRRRHHDPDDHASVHRLRALRVPITALCVECR